jgi:tRNA U34 5-methylaminomethyl-2-thiouridine-forming methyltransferase MnmC
MSEDIEAPITPDRDHRSIIELIDHLEYLVHRAQRVPFTHNVMIDEDEVLDLLDQIHVNMPEEIKQSRVVLSEQERLLSEAQQESSRITQTAAQKAESMVTSHELARKAEAQGQAVIREAQQRAEDQKRAADEYAAEVMQQLESHLVRTVATVRKAQETLKKPIPTPAHKEETAARGRH